MTLLGIKLKRMVPAFKKHRDPIEVWKVAHTLTRFRRFPNAASISRR